MSRLADYRRDLLRQLFRTTPVSGDLASVTCIDTEREVHPGSTGIEQAAVDRIWQLCESLYCSGVYPMLSLCLRRHGEIVINRSIGHYRDDLVASIDTPVCLFSASKAVSAMLVHLLAEQRRIELKKPVSHYIPAFAANGKRSITISQMLIHKSGIGRIPDGTDINLVFDHDAAMEMICAAQPSKHVGRAQAYHALTSGFVFDELIRVTTGMDAQQYLDRYIRKPMRMRYFRYGVQERDRARVAINTVTGLNSGLINRALGTVLGTHPDTAVNLTNDPRFYRAIIPSANIFATAEEVSRFYQMLLDRGQWQGKRVIAPLTVQRATRSAGGFKLDRALLLPMRYSAGFMLGGSPLGLYGLDTAQAFGHLGFSNIFCWADPRRDIAVSLMTTGKPVLGPHLKHLLELMHVISSECLAAGGTSGMTSPPRRVGSARRSRT